MAVIPQSDSRFTVELTGEDLQKELKRRFPSTPTKRLSTRRNKGWNPFRSLRRIYRLLGLK